MARDLFTRNESGSADDWSAPSFRSLPPAIRFGTCSWKYDDWRGILYPLRGKINHLEQYAARLPTVEVDQWFWSLFAPGQVVLPAPSVVADYAASVPPDFRFTVKAPNSVSLTHHYSLRAHDQLLPNPDFLSSELFSRFLALLQPLGTKLGLVMLQFEYLNRRKMSGLTELLDRLGRFLDATGPGVPIGIELRNPSFLTPEYFDFLRSRGLSHVFCDGYYMPSAAAIYRRQADRLAGPVVLRLMGPDRKAIEEKGNARWDRLLDPRDAQLDEVADMLTDLVKRAVPVYVNVNNHYEGCAPLTIRRLASRLARKE